MNKKTNIKSILGKLKEKHKLSFTNDTTYHEKWSFRLSSLNLISLFVLYSITIIILLILLIRLTPLKSLFVDNANLYELNQKLETNSILIDSLESNIVANDNYLNDLKKVLRGEDMKDLTEDSTHFLADDYKPDFSKNKADSLLRYKIEHENTSSNVSLSNESEYGFFMSPVHGLISKSFNGTEKHYGVDVVTKKDEPIKATLEGVVLFSNWTSTEGNVIIIQHHNSIVSAYKHCSVLLRKLGDKVDVGDPIAIVGDSGEYTNGPHLHFEIWQNGTPLNPQEFISF